MGGDVPDGRRQDADAEHRAQCDGSGCYDAINGSLSHDPIDGGAFIPRRGPEGVLQRPHSDPDSVRGVA